MKNGFIFISGITVGILAALLVKHAQRHNGKPAIVYDNRNQIKADTASQPVRTLLENGSR